MVARGLAEKTQRVHMARLRVWQMTAQLSLLIQSALETL
jgi:hypothetical protein